MATGKLLISNVIVVLYSVEFVKENSIAKSPSTHRIVGVRLIGFEFSMVAELNVNCPATELSHTRGIVIYHRRSSIFICHFQECLQQKITRIWLEKSIRSENLTRTIAFLYISDLS